MARTANDDIRVKGFGLAGWLLVLDHSSVAYRCGGGLVSLLSLLGLCFLRPTAVNLQLIGTILLSRDTYLLRGVSASSPIPLLVDTEPLQRP
jgi:hypothetical protein